MRARFEKARVDMAKGAPSATSRHQELDRGTMFRGMKDGLNQVNDKEISVECDVLRRHLKNMFKLLREKYSQINVSDKFESKVIHGLLATTYVAKKSWNATKMRESCIVTGFHREPKFNGDITVDYHKVMACTLNKEIKDFELAHMDLMKDEVATEIRQHGKLLFIIVYDSLDNDMFTGRVTNAFLDGLGVVKCEEAESRDDLVLWRRDIEVITHVDSVERFNAYLHEKELRANADFQALEKEKQTLRKELQRQERLAASRLKAEEEKKRKASLSKEELQAEKAAAELKKREKKAKKDALTEKALTAQRNGLL